MHIQDIALSHNKKKKLLKQISDSSVLFEDESGDIVVNVENYKNFKQEQENCLLEDILADEKEQLDWNAQYFVFS
ncbi:MAG: hypothetical protein HRU20_19560 [Pseudomonadales bacterium]|nr:hypothetical protein [Pseudomonadales bacterium]